MGAWNTSDSWGWLARLLHWAMALMILGLLGVGVWMTNFEKDLIAQIWLTQHHKNIGFVVFFLGLARVVWRIANPTPALPAHMPRWQVLASHASHGLLYLFLFMLPLTGWAMATSSPLNDPGGYIQIQNHVFVAWPVFEGGSFFSSESWTEARLNLFLMPDPWPTGDEALSQAFHTLHFWSGVGLASVLILHIGAALKHHAIDRDGLLRRMWF